MWPFTKRKEPGEEHRSIEGFPWPGVPWNIGGLPPYYRVTPEHALRLYPVFGAARLLADMISSLPPVLYVMGRDGVPQPQPLPSLLVQPSIHGTYYDWMFRCVISMALHGDATGHVTARNYYGFPTMAEWLNPVEVQVHDEAVSGAGSYMNPLWYWRGRPINREDIIHIPWFTVPYRVRGHSPIGAYQITTNIGLGAQEYASAWFHNGGVPPGVLKNANQKIQQQDADLLTERVTNRLRQRKPLVIGNDWEYTPIQIKPNEAQFVECAVGSTMFSMADGTLRRADELVVGDRIIAWDGQKQVADRVCGAVEMPVGPTIRVTTACGHELTTSPRHPYLASRRPRSAGKRYKGTLDGNADWVKASELRPGDYVRIGLDWDGSDPDEAMDIETAWSLGALIGDGHLPTGRSLTFTSIESGIIGRLGEWLQRYGAELVQCAPERAPADYRIKAGSPGTRSALRIELDKFGVLGVKAAQKRVPDVVMRGGPKAWAAFLSGYLDTDGTVANPASKSLKAVWSSVSPDLLRDCQHMLAMLGVKSSVRLHTKGGAYQVRGRDCVRQDGWNLYVCGIVNLRRLAQVLDPAHPVKARRLQDIAALNVGTNGVQSDPRWTQIVSVEDAGEQATYGITIEGTHTHVTNGLVTHNTCQLTATQIAVIYGIPPEMIGGQTGGSLTYNTVTQNALNFLTFSLRPWLVRIETALSNLFPRGQFVRFDTTELLRTDPLQKAQIDQLALGYYPPAYKTIDEVRQSNYLPPVPAEQLPPMYRPGGGAVPGEPPNPPQSAPPPPYLSGNGQHPVGAGAN